MKKQPVWLIVVWFLMVAPLAAQLEYHEIRDPSLQLSKLSMRAHQVQYTMFLFYTMNLDVPGYVETGGYNRLTQDGNIEMVPFYRWRAGPVVETGRELDVFLDAYSRGFFVVKVATGGYGYTRDGRFDIDSRRRLVTLSHRLPVIGAGGGEIFLPEGDYVNFSKSGAITVNGNVIDRLRIVTFTKSGLDKLITLNGSYFVATAPIGDTDVFDGEYGIRQYHIEQSNVLKALVGDVGLLKRGYEGTAKAAKVINRVMSSVSQMASP